MEDVKSIHCDYCTDISGMYLGMTCPGCNRPFRSVKQEAYVHFIALSKFDNEYSWEFNLDSVVRWGSEEASDDVSFYVKHWLEKIADQEGYKLVKK